MENGVRVTLPLAAAVLHVTHTSNKDITKLYLMLSWSTPPKQLGRRGRIQRLPIHTLHIASLRGRTKVPSLRLGRLQKHINAHIEQAHQDWIRAGTKSYAVAR
mmetsp:Transcript_19026/g.52133  ORF Transcript_19026/g.52133 Transcript_19026/m.52133 type:complete len:103 (-) Transcript_19026:700-1008(-)